MVPGETHRKVNAKAFVADFARGSSDEELCEKYALTGSNLTRLVAKLKEADLLTPTDIERREENLGIRFGLPKAAPQGHAENALHVDTDTGLVLHCPSCGGPVARSASHCDYCRSPLDFNLKGKTIPCPHCFASNPADGSFCIRCAQPLKGLVRDGEVLPDRLCPRCETPMSAKSIGEFSTIGCNECSGLFITNETFETMQANSVRVIFPAGKVPRSPLNPEATVRYIRCPVCRNIMNRMNFARISGVIIDSCSAHGIWFDADELEKIMDFIVRGGLQRAHEKALEELKAEEELVKIRAMNVNGPYSEYSGHWGAANQPGAVDVFEVLKDIYRLFKR